MGPHSHRYGLGLQVEETEGPWGVVLVFLACGVGEPATFWRQLGSLAQPCARRHGACFPAWMTASFPPFLALLRCCRRCPAGHAPDTLGDEWARGGLSGRIRRVTQGGKAPRGARCAHDVCLRESTRRVFERKHDVCLRESTRRVFERKHTTCVYPGVARMYQSCAARGKCAAARRNPHSTRHWPALRHGHGRVPDRFLTRPPRSAPGAIFGLFAVSVLTRLRWQLRPLLEAGVLGIVVVQRVSGGSCLQGPP
jgi:hypothetical protein